MNRILFAAALLSAAPSLAGPSWAQSAAWGGSAGVAALRGYTAAPFTDPPGGAGAAAGPGLLARDAVATLAADPAPLLHPVPPRPRAGRGGPWNRRFPPRLP